MREWFLVHGADGKSCWLVTFKKGDARYLTYDEIVRVLIANGWVDSQPKALDDKRSMRLISPRKLGSNWSKANRLRAEELIDAGEMTAQGQLAVDTAKRDGSWTALVDIEAGVIPEDLLVMLESRAGAATNFEAFPPSSRRLILEWINTAKTTKTRQKRLRETADKAARNERANHYR